MSSWARDADGRGPEGREKRLNVGKAFMKRIAYRMRGGSATPEIGAFPFAHGHADSSDDLVLEVEGKGAFASDPGAILAPTPAHEIESDIPQIPSQTVLNAHTLPFTSSRGADRHERTRRLLAKYGLSVEAQDWMPADSNSPATVLRVEKQIRMRIRYTCHLCERLFGADRSCKTCNHKRCQQCPRHPPKWRGESKNREEADKENSTKDKLAIDTDVVILRKREHEEVENITRSRSRGKKQASEDTAIPVTQLLQHCCHKCNTAFEQRSRLCSSCGHIRCSRCPRNLVNYTDNKEEQLRPERVHRLPRLRIRWICDHCENTFTEGSKVCGECLHKRCQACRRIPPKKAKLDHEENVETIQDWARVPGIS